MFCDVIKGQLLYLWRRSYRNSSKDINSPLTVTLHLDELLMLLVGWI